MAWADSRTKRLLRANAGSVIFALVILTLFSGLLLYSGIWPPLSTVESNSMEHSDDTSYLGVIDTGDMVVVQRADTYGQVRTYVDSFGSGPINFGDYGDVVIYRPYGDSGRTPIIHRAIVLLRFNGTSELFDIPSLSNLPVDKWSHDGASDGKWWSLSGTLALHHVGYKDEDVTIELDTLVRFRHDGLITKGDHNDKIDQFEGSSVCQEPVLQRWIVGVAKLEVPWFGLLPLWAGGQYYPYGDGVHANSWTEMFVVLTVFIGMPIALDLTTTIMRDRGVDIWERPKSALKHLFDKVRRR